MKAMKGYESQLQRLEQHADELARSHDLVKQEMNDFKTRWFVTFARIGERQNQLATAQAKAPSRSYMEMIQLLLRWIEDLDKKLNSEQLKVVELQHLKEQLSAWQVSS